MKCNEIQIYKDLTLKHRRVSTHHPKKIMKGANITCQYVKVRVEVDMLAVLAEVAALV